MDGYFTFRRLLIYIYSMWPDLRKGGLPNTSNSMNLEDCNLEFKANTNLKFSTPINLRMLVLTTDQFSRQWLFSIWSYELIKLVIWMCVDGPFRKSSHILNWGAWHHLLPFDVVCVGFPDKKNVNKLVYKKSGIFNKSRDAIRLIKRCWSSAQSYKPH